IHSIESKKYGLPRAQIIFWLISANKPTTPTKVNQNISVEIPDPTIDPIGYDDVTKVCFMAYVAWLIKLLHV
ncbi:hypothetical protein LINPERPRIM_LOCUS25838, partial [Linum perenne]